MRPPGGGRHERARPAAASGERCDRREAGVMSERDQQPRAASDATAGRPGVMSERDQQHEAWEDVLTSLEHDLAALRATLDDLDRPAPAPTFDPPDDLGALPPEMARRALGLAAAYEAAV